MTNYYIICGFFIKLERKIQIGKADVLENRKMITDFKAKCKVEEEEENAAIQIHAAAKKRVARIRKEKDREVCNILFFYN